MHSAASQEAAFCLWDEVDEAVEVGVGIGTETAQCS